MFTNPEPADIILHQNEQGSWHGHVMLCLAFDVDTGRVLIAEGNHSKSMGPSGKRYTSGTYGEDQTRRQGIGMRWLSVRDTYLDWTVRV